MRLIDDLSVLPPAYGLAVDEALLESTRTTGVGAVRLWVNDRSIIVGRAQAVDEEVDTGLAATEGVPFLRRLSGGGAVFHHPGNLNVTVCVPGRLRVGGVEGAFLFLGRRVAESIAPWGGGVRAEGNRLVSRGRKLGGAAQVRRSGVLLYHTTVIVDADALRMKRFLLAHRPGYAPMTVASRPGMLTALSAECGRSVKMDDVAESIGRAMVRHFALEPAGLTASEMRRAHRLVEEKYLEESWIWRRRAIST